MIHRFTQDHRVSNIHSHIWFECGCVVHISTDFSRCHRHQPMSNSHLDWMSNINFNIMKDLVFTFLHSQKQEQTTIKLKVWAASLTAVQLNWWQEQPSHNSLLSFHVNRLHEGACWHARCITLCYRWQVHRIAPDFLIIQLPAAALMRDNALSLRERGQRESLREMTLQQENHFLQDDQDVINSRTLPPRNDHAVIYLHLPQILQHLPVLLWLKVIQNAALLSRKIKKIRILTTAQQRRWRQQSAPSPSERNAEFHQTWFTWKRQDAGLT